jgi:hypothetical protein
VEFNLNILPNNAVHVSGFRGEDERIIELTVVSLVDTVFIAELVTLMMEAIRSSETSVLKRAVGLNIPKTAFFKNVIPYTSAYITTFVT